MRLGRLTIDRSASGFQLVDHGGGVTIDLTRHDARFLFCWLMYRLNVQDAILTDGRKVSGFYHLNEIKEAMDAIEKEVLNNPDRA